MAHIWACSAPEPPTPDPPDDTAREPARCVATDPTVEGTPGPDRWEAVPAEVSGFDQLHWDGARRCAHEALLGGAAVGDVDDDGDLDVFLPVLGGPDGLWLNDGSGTFAQAAHWQGSPQSSSGALFVDVDGDRDLDLFVASLGPDPALLYINDGNGGFREEAAPRGASLWTPTDEAIGDCADNFGVSAADVDADGDLDLFVASWQPRAELGTTRRNRLLLNEGDGTFVDGTTAWGLDALADRAPFGALFADLDGDAWPEMHLVGDWQTSGLWRNDGMRLKPVDSLVYSDENGMGSDLGDVDGDGDLDWFVGSIRDPAPECPDGWGCSGNRLYAWTGTEHLDVSESAGVIEGQWTWGSAFVDRDLDGDLDLVLTGGFPVDPFRQRAGTVYDNDGSGRFTAATCEAGWTWASQGRTVIPLDADRDGVLDLLLVDAVERPTLWRGRVAEPRGWLGVELEQPGANPFGIGARIRIQPTPGAPWQLRLLHANTLYLGGPAPEIHVGMGSHTGSAHRLEVHWPDGAVDRYDDVGPGRVRLVRP
ncbi:MAG: CRTAC1 family protein [Myxococcales bacterium]|nr:CRTAC1 family protein [Myxococcales bacterium]